MFDFFFFFAKSTFDQISQDLPILFFVCLLLFLVNFCVFVVVFAMCLFVFGRVFVQFLL